MCVTEREKFVVPVRAIGARALLDFPDKVNFPTSPVKVGFQSWLGSGKPTLRPYNHNVSPSYQY